MPNLFTPQFTRLCLGYVLFMASFNMLIPELPGWLDSMGGGAYKGWVIGLFTITAGLARPFSGKLTDSVGRIPVILVGIVVCVLCGFAYLVATSVLMFLAVRFLHGFSTGFTPTGVTTYVADISSDERRGEAMGYIGIAGNIGMGLGPVIGSSISTSLSIDYLFISSSVLAMLSFFILRPLKETGPAGQQNTSLWMAPRDILEPRVLIPAMVLLCSAYTFGAILTLIPDLCGYTGIRNKGSFFAVFVVATVLARAVAGRWSDKQGRVPVLLTGTGLQVLGVLLLAFSSSGFELYAGAAVVGFAAGMNSPVLMAWTIDRSASDHKGRALATSFLAMEAGIGGGAFLSGAIYRNQAANFQAGLLTAAAFAFVGFSILAAQRLMVRESPR